MFVARVFCFLLWAFSMYIRSTNLVWCGPCGLREWLLALSFLGHICGEVYCMLKSEKLFLCW